MAAAAPNPNPNNNGPERARKIFNSSMDEDIRAKLLRENAYTPQETSLPPEEATTVVQQNPQPDGTRRPWWSSGTFPLFWTVASAISLTVNVILCLLIFGLLWFRGPITKVVTGQSSSVLGGLYSNFQAMDRATIKATVPVEGTIPVTINNITVPVRTTTTILVQPGQVACLSNIRIVTGGLNLNAPGCITFGQETPLRVNLNLDIPLQNINLDVPVHLSVPVTIPLRDTELHQPFVGLQEVVRPWYCLFLPKSETLFMQTCANTQIPSLTGTIIP
jgi:hypothetical protein